MFILYAKKNQLTVRDREPITSGSVNIYSVQFEFSKDWDGLEKIAVFRTGKETVSVHLDASGQCTIPWEVISTPNSQLSAGVYGIHGEDTVLPTVWASLGTILEGTAPGESTKPPPTPGLYEQILEVLSRKGDNLSYDGAFLSLNSGEKKLSTVLIKSGGDTSPVYGVGHGLKVVSGNLAVNSVDDFKGDNTLPITAAGVQTVVGNIEVLLSTI